MTSKTYAMKNTFSRRNFLKKGSTFCVVCGAIAACPGLKAMNNYLDDEEIPDPKKREYCGYKCPDDCRMYTATINKDAKSKKIAWENWKLKEHYGIDFDPDKIYCYTCKPGDKPLGINVKKCDVRNCAIEKGYECCIECKELKDCKKGVFTRFPEFHEGVVKLQEKYLQSKKS
jgi:hypothetical protein